MKIKQSKETSKIIWIMIYVARWAFNMGVETAFKNPKLPLRNSYTILTKLNHEHIWTLKYTVRFLRANYPGHPHIILKVFILFFYYNMYAMDN